MARRRSRNPFSLGGIIPKSLFGKEMLTSVVGGAVGYFAVKKLPAMLPATWGATGNTWQGWAAKVAILFAGNYVIGNVFKKPALAKSVMLGGAIAVVAEALTMNFPALAGTVYFVPQRQLAGTGALIPANAGTAARRPIVTSVGAPQNRHS
jgi:hypothetical protein